ncbi:MAG TPA: hypothetical protein VN837_06670, partial [Chloroflexota bacterium]|nr:hypothetical protein [Chloroflexota bacterium]
ASLRVTQRAGAAHVSLTLQQVPIGAAVAARWTFPDGSTSVWQAPPAYSTDPSYSAFLDLSGPGHYQVAALVNGQPVGAQDFTVAAQASPSHAGNQDGDGPGHDSGPGKGDGHDKGHD